MANIAPNHGGRITYFSSLSMASIVFIAMYSGFTVGGRALNLQEESFINHLAKTVQWNHTLKQYNTKYNETIDHTTEQLTAINKQ
jgi:hypothetical protein